MKRIKKSLKVLSAFLIVSALLFSSFSYTASLNSSHPNVTAVAKTESNAPIWPMFRYNQQHTGRCPYDTSQNNGTLKWRYQTGDYIRSSSPAIASDGTIYVGSENHYLYAFNPYGTLKWRYETGDVIDSSPAIASDGTVYVGSLDDSLYAINPDGSLKWRYGTGNEIRSSPAIASDGTIYVGSLDDSLYAIGGGTSEVTFTLHIPTNWSIISVPFETDPSLLTGNANIQYLFYWDGNFWQIPATLNPGIGYLVYNISSSTINITLTGIPTSSPFTENTTGDWQVIGNPFNTTCSLSSTSTITYSLYWDGNFWQLVDINNLQPGIGYLILTDSSGTLTFTSSP